MSTNKITISRKPKIDHIDKDSQPIAIIGPNGRAIKVGGRVYNKLVKENGGVPDVKSVGRPKNSTKYVGKEPPKRVTSLASSSIRVKTASGSRPKTSFKINDDIVNEDDLAFKKLEKMYFKLKASQPLSDSSDSENVSSLGSD
jgi:hypothetical protein